MSGHQALRGGGAEAQGLENGRQGSTVTVTVPDGAGPQLPGPGTALRLQQVLGWVRHMCACVYVCACIVRVHALRVRVCACMCVCAGVYVGACMWVPVPVCAHA